MKIEIPRMYAELRLGDYAPEFGEEVIRVWVNPTRRMLDELEGIFRGIGEVVNGKTHHGDTETTERGTWPLSNAEKEAALNALGVRLQAWVSEVWEGWTAAEVADFVRGSLETDPRLWGWLVEQTRDLIAAHRSAQKKGSGKPR